VDPVTFMLCRRPERNGTHPGWSPVCLSFTWQPVSPDPWHCTLWYHPPSFCHSKLKPILKPPTLHNFSPFILAIFAVVQRA